MQAVDINQIAQSLKKYFRGNKEIEAAYIFGSTMLGKTNALSDIDIAILIDRKKLEERLYPYGYKAYIITDLMKLLRTNRVDLVILNEAPPLLRHRVLYTGKLIYSENEKRRIQFQVESSK
ncbi:nucleotidyltransferase domain protein [archaeon]|nr:nucleotidyltransferase domain protein [archaeon]